MDLRGEVFLDAESPGPVGTAQVVLVNRQRVRLPADPARLAQVIHPAPLAFLWGAITVLFQSLPGWDSVPIGVTAFLAAVLSAAGWWAHSRLTRRGRISPQAILIAALLLGALQALVTSALARPDSGRLPFLFFMPWVAPLLGFYLRDLPVIGRSLVLGGCALASALGSLAWPDLLMFSSVPLALLWPLAGAVSVSGLRSALDADIAELRHSFARRYSEAVDTAFKRGRDHVIEITSSAVTEISWRFATTPLPVAEKAEVGRRLAEATDLLATLIQAVDSQR
jgi:hypothetical protein